MKKDIGTEKLLSAVERYALFVARLHDIPDAYDAAMRLATVCADEIRSDSALAEELSKDKKSYKSFVRKMAFEAADAAIRQQLFPVGEKASMRENLIATAAFRAGHMESMCSISVGGTVEDEDDLANFCAYLASKWHQESPDCSYDEFIETALVERYGS